MFLKREPARCLQIPGVRLAATRAGFAEDAAPTWQLAALAGRLVEVSGAGARAGLTAVTQLVWQVQQDQGLVAWLVGPAAVFFPPDLFLWGVDLQSLVVVRSRTQPEMVKAADRLLRCGAFAMVVIDLVGMLPSSLSMAELRRFSGYLQETRVAVCLTDKPDEAPSLGAMVSLRVAPMRTRSASGPAYTVRSIKDKRHGTPWQNSEPVDLLAGLRR